MWAENKNLLGFGAWAVGGDSYGKVDKADVFDAFDCYFENGGTFIDTAQVYGNCEELLGEYLADRKWDVTISTKTFAGKERESVCEIEKRLDESLRKLKMDSVDIYYLHFPSEDEETMRESLEVMADLKKKGKIRAVGASIKGINVTDDTVNLAKTYIDTGKVDVIQAIYSIFRQRNEEWFDYAGNNGVKVVARTCLESGFLTGKYLPGHVFSQDDHRHRWGDKLDSILNSVEVLKQTITEGEWDNNITSLALRFATCNKDVWATIIGAKNRSQMQALIDYYNKPLLEEEICVKLHELYGKDTDDFNA